MSDSLINSVQPAFSNIEKWSILILVLLSFTGISVAYIGKAMLTPLHLLMGFFIAYSTLVSKKANKKISISLTLLIGYILLINLIQFPNIRYTSVLYTVIYGIEVTILYNMLRRCRPKAVLYAFRLIVYLYFINLFIGFTMDTLGIRSPLIEQFIRIYYSEAEPGGRPMGFSSEPSYAALILAAIFLSYSHLRKHTLDKDTIKMILLIIFSILFSKSAYGFIFIAVLVLDWFLFYFKKADHLTRNILPFCMTIGVTGIVLISSQINNPVITRIIEFSSVAMDDSYAGKAKLQKLQEADGSAFARIGPTYLLFAQRDNKDIDLVIGKGAGAAGKFMSTFLEGILVDEGRDSVDTGIIPALIFDYGIIGSFLFLLFLASSFYRLPFPFWLLFFLILPNANINTQVIWFTISCFLFVNITMIKAR